MAFIKDIFENTCDWLLDPMSSTSRFYKRLQARYKTRSSYVTSFRIGYVNSSGSTSLTRAYCRSHGNFCPESSSYLEQKWCLPV